MYEVTRLVTADYVVTRIPGCPGQGVLVSAAPPVFGPASRQTVLAPAPRYRFPISASAVRSHRPSAAPRPDRRSANL